MDTTKTPKEIIVESLSQAKDLIAQASKALFDIQVVEQLEDGEIGVKKEFEDYAFQIGEINDALRLIKEDRAGHEGKLDEMERIAKEKITAYFEARPKFKKYEGEKIEIGFRQVVRKVISNLDIVDPRFVVIKKEANTKAIDAYIKSTTDEQNPQGLVPKGIEMKKYQYVNFKNISNE